MWYSHDPSLDPVSHTAGPILELGCGDYSTPILHALCSAQQRPLVSMDNAIEWVENFLDLETSWHSFILDNNWTQVDLSNRWSVVLVDHAPASQRIIDIQRLRSNTDIFVIHDTEDSGYRYESILPTFKYRYDYKRYKTMTTLVSDTIDVAALFNNKN